MSAALGGVPCVLDVEELAQASLAHGLHLQLPHLHFHAHGIVVTCYHRT